MCAHESVCVRRFSCACTRQREREKEREQAVGKRLKREKSREGKSESYIGSRDTHTKREKEREDGARRRSGRLSKWPRAQPTPRPPPLPLPPAPPPPLFLRRYSSTSSERAASRRAAPRHDEGTPALTRLNVFNDNLHNARRARYPRRTRKFKSSKGGGRGNARAV